MKESVVPLCLMGALVLSAPSLSQTGNGHASAWRPVASPPGEAVVLMAVWCPSPHDVLVAGQGATGSLIACASLVFWLASRRRRA